MSQTAERFKTLQKSLLWSNHCIFPIRREINNSVAAIFAWSETPACLYTWTIDHTLLSLVNMLFI